MRNSETSFNVGLLNRKYAQGVSETPCEVIRDPDGSGWLVEPEQRLTMQALAKKTYQEPDGWHEKRLAEIADAKHVEAWRSVVSALADGNEKDVRTAWQIFNTHKMPVVSIHRPDGKVGVIPGTVRERLNPFQMLETAGTYQACYSRLVGEIKEARPDSRFSMLTLTIGHWEGLPLAHSMRIVLDAWSRFSRSAYFKKHVHGYVRGLETPKGDNGWHVHIHCFMECDFLDIPKLWNLWLDRVEKAARKVREEDLDAYEIWALNQKLLRTQIRRFQRTIKRLGTKAKDWLRYQNGLAQALEEQSITRNAPFVLTESGVNKVLPGLNGVQLDERDSAAEAVGYVAKMELLTGLEGAEIRELNNALRNRKLVRGCKHWGSRAAEIQEEIKAELHERELEQGIERHVLAELADGVQYGERVEELSNVARACHQIGFLSYAQSLAKRADAAPSEIIERPPEKPSWWSGPWSWSAFNEVMKTASTKGADPLYRVYAAGVKRERAVEAWEAQEANLPDNTNAE